MVQQQVLQAICAGRAMSCRSVMDLCRFDRVECDVNYNANRTITNRRKRFAWRADDYVYASRNRRYNHRR